jgi:hypothetical protein
MAWPPDITLGSHTERGAKLRGSVNKMLRKICGYKEDMLIRGWEKMHNADFHSL